MLTPKRPRRALIVGASGQDGRIMSGLLLSKNFEVFGVTKKSSESGHVENGVTEIKSDLSNPELFSELMKAVRPDFILHLAAVHSNSREMQTLESTHSNEMFRCHVEITKNVLEWQRINLCSSLIALTSLIFTPKFPREEILLTNSYQPQNEYGRTKLEALELIRYYRQKFGIKTAGLVLFNHSSEFTKPKFLIPTIASKIWKASKTYQITRILHSQQLVDMSNSHNFCRGFLKMIESDVFEDLIFSSGEMRTIESLYVEAISRIEPRLRSRFEFDDLGMGIPSMFGNIEKTRSLLEWDGGGDPVQIIEKIFNTKEKQTI